MKILFILPVLFLGFSVHAAPPPNADPALHDWFQGLRQPKTGYGCCSVADCRPTQYRVVGDDYEIFTHDHWIKVPPDKILQNKENPTGEAIVCKTGDDTIYCFIRPSET